MNPTAIGGTDGAFIALNIGVVVVVALAIVYAAGSTVGRPWPDTSSPS